MCVCVCFGDSYAQILLNWETILRDYCVDLIIGWVVCWIAFISVFFSSWKIVLKSWLDTSSIACYLSSFLSLFLITIPTSPRYLVDDRECSCLLDSFSIPGGLIELLFLDLIPCCSIPQLSMTIFSTPTSTASSTPHLSRFIEGLYIPSSRSISHFFDLSRSVRACSSPKHSLFHSKPLPWDFSSLFQVFFSLGKFLISLSSRISRFET